MNYTVSRNSNGEVDSINRTDGVLVPTWNPYHPLTIEFQQWLATHPEFDMAKHPPEPDNISRPNWEQFRGQIIMNSAYIRIATASPEVQALIPILIWLLGEISKDNNIFNDLINTWNAIAYFAIPTESEIIILNRIATACNLPLQLDANGMMIDWNDDRRKNL